MRTFLPVFLSLLSLHSRSTAGTAITSMTLTGIGGSGQYFQVTNQLNGTWPNCPATPPSCVRAVHHVSGNLSPFNEEMSIQLRGPMIINNIAVYQPDKTGTVYNRVSYWTRGGKSAENLSFLNNLGGGASGEWSICQGNSLSWASSDATKDVARPTVFGGTLGNGVEMTVLSGHACTPSSCGWYRPVGMHGWSGEKIIIVEATMPHNIPGYANKGDKPAIWSLNAQIPRTAQYGCNCDRRGCGELDIAEVVTEGEEHCWVTMYSWQKSVGSGDWFVRPTNNAAVFATHFDVPGKTIRISQFKSFKYSKTMATSVVKSWAKRPGTVITV